jgi:integrase
MGTCLTILPETSLNMTSPITFTRYLYLKDEVQLSLLIALLNKKDTALHWAFELYYSGFEEELFQHLWKIYYDFYYTLNPSFQDYFVKKYKEWGKTMTQDRERIIALLVGDLLIRPHNLDIFMLRQAIKYTEEEFSNVDSFEELLESRDYLHIANHILERKNNLNSLQIVKESIAYFSKKGIKIEEDKMVKRWKKFAKYLGMDESVQILAFIMCHFSKLE